MSADLVLNVIAYGLTPATLAVPLIALAVQARRARRRRPEPEESDLAGLGLTAAELVEVESPGAFGPVDQPEPEETDLTLAERAVFRGYRAEIEAALARVPQ